MITIPVSLSDFDFLYSKPINGVYTWKTNKPQTETKSWKHLKEKLLIKKTQRGR